MIGLKSEVQIMHFLWYGYPGGKNDKIWGYVAVSDKTYCFWGRRGTSDGAKSLQFKREDDFVRLSSLVTSKERKGYKQQSLTFIDGSYIDIDKVYPGFFNHLKNELMLAKLYGTVRRENERN